MIVVVCSAIIRRGDAFLMVKESKPSAAGKWGLPGGKLEEGESVIDGVRREVQEETGYAVTSEKLLSIVNKPKTHEGNTVIRFVFQCKVSDAPASAAGHDSDFVPLAKVEALESQGLVRGQEVVPLFRKVLAEPEAISDDLLRIL